MIKKLLILAFAGLLSPAFAAGTVPGFSLAQQQDSNGAPLVGCKLYTIQAGTTSTPQSGYQDSALTLPLSNPIICDAYGRLPQIFLADGSIKLRLTKSNGVQVFAADGILVVGASSGGGGGSPVDATTILATGDVKTRYGTGTLTGFVRANGRTIGSATSGASERANADTQALFEYLWGADTTLTVSTGRGASSNADWTANKTITLPDARGLSLAGLDDMGNTPRGIFTGATFFNGSATVLGSGLGTARRTLTQPMLPNVNFVVASGQTVSVSGILSRSAGTTGGGTTGLGLSGNAVEILTMTSTGTVTSAGTAASGGSGSAFDTVSPYLLVTLYIKL